MVCLSALLAAHLAFANIGAPQCITDTILPPDTRCEAPESVYAYFNHNSSEWDRPARTRTASIQLKELVDRKKIPAFIASSQFGVSNFVQPGKGDFALLSQGGENGVIFSNLRRMILSGGNLSACLCAAFSDILAHLPANPAPLEMLFVLEATYSARVDSVLKDIQTPRLETFGTLELPVSVVSEELQKDSFYSYLDKNLLGNSSGFLCRYPTPFQFDDRLPLTAFTFEVQRNGKSLGPSVGTGPKHIRLNFVTLSELERILAQ